MRRNFCWQLFERPPDVLSVISTIISKTPKPWNWKYRYSWSLKNRTILKQSLTLAGPKSHYNREICSCGDDYHKRKWITASQWSHIWFISVWNLFLKKETWKWNKESCYLCLFQFQTRLYNLQNKIYPAVRVLFLSIFIQKIKTILLSDKKKSIYIFENNHLQWSILKSSNW